MAELPAASVRPDPAVPGPGANGAGAAQGDGAVLSTAPLDDLIDPVSIARPLYGDDGAVCDFTVTYTNRAALVWSAQVGVSWVGRADVEGAALLPGYLEAYDGGHPLLLDAFGVPSAGPHTRYVDLRAMRVGPDLLLTWRDVTSRHEAERALAHSETRFRMAFDEAPVGMVIASLEAGRPSRYLQVNEAFAQLLGWSEETLVGSPCADLVHPDDLGTDSAETEEMVSGTRTRFQSEKRMRCANGRWVWARMSASVVDRDGGQGYLIAHVEDVTARRAAEAELARRALYDPLTGLANRTLLLDHLNLAIRELGRERAALAVLYLDLDRFKDVNDTLGHDAGDEVIRQIGGRLGMRVRSPDTAARLAGDEFVVAARVRDDVQAARIAERLHAALSAPMVVRNRQLVVRPSIGVTTTTSPRARPEDLLREADLAMYQAKRNRRRPWALYDAALHRLALERLAVEESLRLAVHDNRFRLLYQPIIDLSNGRIVSAEALLRLWHPERGLLGPDTFIDVAEDSDLIVPIGEWVLDEACRELARWQAQRPDMQIAVNVSARQVSHLVLRDQVVAATSAAGVDASRVQLEITERVLVDAGEEVSAELRGVAGHGCGLAIDDFGTGYSSLAYLKRFPVSAVKIDRSFVGGLGRGGEDSAIVEAVAGLAHTLDLTAVAEGVESSEQLVALRRLGCHRAQGFHIGYPLPAEQILALLCQAG